MGTSHRSSQTATPSVATPPAVAAPATTMGGGGFGSDAALGMQDSAGNAAAVESMQAGAPPRGDLSGDPTTGTDLTFAPVDADDAQGLPAVEFTEGHDVSWAVEILHDQSDPLPFNGTPDASQLFTVIDDDADQSLPGALPVQYVEGDVSQPQVNQQLAPDALFVGGGPSAADVEQGYFGDCYFLAVVGQLAQQDPGKISDGLSVSGTTVSFTFHAFDPAGPAWNEEPVSSSTELAFDVTSDGDLNGLHGAGIHADPLPRSSAWWVDYHAPSSSMTIMRDDEHDAAIWVAYLEKLYLIFAETHGQYGDALDPSSRTNPTQDSAGNQESGFDIADGGFEHLVYQVFYGGDVVLDRSLDMSWDPTSMSNTVVQNKNIIRRLLQLDGQGIGTDRAAMMTAWADSDVHFDRLKDQIDLITDDPDSRRYRTLRSTLVRISERIERYTNETDNDKKERFEGSVVRSAARLAKPGNWPLLHSPTADKKWHDLLELASDVQHAGTDSSNGTRNVYSGHAYSVMGATFVDTNGAAMALDPRALDADLPNVDPERSSVELRNPHHTNEPDMQGEGPADGTDDGRFDMTLDQFFRNLSGIDLAVVNT